MKHCKCGNIGGIPRTKCKCCSQIIPETTKPAPKLEEIVEDDTEEILKDVYKEYEKNEEHEERYEKNEEHEERYEK